MWTREEDDRLLKIVSGSKSPISWEEVATHFPGKTAEQVRDRWVRIVNPSLCTIRRTWSQEEDEVIRAFVAANGPCSWSRLASMLPGRIGKQCRERWHNHLNPEISHDPWTPEEDQKLLAYIKDHGHGSWRALPPKAG